MSFSISQEWAVVLAYAILMGLGGWFGFKKSGSKPSLIAGVLSFSILMVSYFIGQMWVAVGASTFTVTGTTDVNDTLTISTGTLDANGAFDATGGDALFAGLSSRCGRTSGCFRFCDRRRRRCRRVSPPDAGADLLRDDRVYPAVIAVSW